MNSIVTVFYQNNHVDQRRYNYDRLDKAMTGMNEHAKDKNARKVELSVVLHTWQRLPTGGITR